MKIAVLGATGETGGEVVKAALARGISVTAGVRDVSKVPVTHPLLTVKAVDVFSLSSLKTLFIGQDAVISALGFPKSDYVTGFSKSTPIIVSAMSEAGVERLVVVSAWFTEPQSRTHKDYMDLWHFVPKLNKILDDQYRMELILETQAKHIRWVAVKPGSLSWGPPSGRKMKVNPGKEFVDCGIMIRRSDLARCILDVMDGGTIGKVSIAMETTNQQEREEIQNFRRMMADMFKGSAGAGPVQMPSFIKQLDVKYSNRAESLK